VYVAKITVQEFASRLDGGIVIFMYKTALFVTLALTIPCFVGCSSDPDNTSGSTSSSSSGGGGEGGGMAACMPTTPIPCDDQVIQQMNFKTNVAPGLITDAPDGNGFWSTIDATAGGFMYTDSYVYAKFTDKGLVKVDLMDEESITSTDWDIAFRRFVIRINSGNSGPSCVTAAKMKPGVTYDSLTSVPADANFVADEYFTASCELIPEASGLGSPATALHGFWTYVNCVQMSGNIYVVQKADGTAVKLTITDFYEPTLQEQCNTTGAVPMGTPGAMIRMRWALLP
jgi:hypothetical protein